MEPVYHANNTTTNALVPIPIYSVVTVVVLSICFLVGVPGNVAVIVLRKSRQNLSSLTQGLMLNLACSDILCLLTLPLWIYSYLISWIFGLIGCKILSYLVYCSIYMSLTNVTLLSIQRYVQVVYLQRSLHQKWLLLLLPWLVGLVMASPALVVRELVLENQQVVCQRIYSSDGQRLAVRLVETLVGFVVPVSIVTFSYMNLYLKVKRGCLGSNHRVTKIVTRIIITFFVLWIPYHVINILTVAAILSGSKALLSFCDKVGDIAGSLTFVNSCINPVLYAFAARKKPSENPPDSVQTVQQAV